ncbi:MAG TPA: cytochrome b5 domain-containing protein [Bacillota bacterium]|nr:cytochrome b5 domain-containing protein [Bacillota bacterium]HPP85465.1 cytochrome b5 domain-containing protein [Bacillota bacterium]
MRYSFGDFLVNMVKEIKSDVELLGSNACKSKWEVLRQLRDRVSTLESAVEVINREYDLQVQAVPKGEKNAPEAQETRAQTTGSAERAPAAKEAASEPLKVFSKEELAQCTGKDGKPALVAINGLVYDVSDHPAFAAGTHFGVSCGKDVTETFVRMHGDDRFKQLKLVGKLA